MVPVSVTSCVSAALLLESHISLVNFSPSASIKPLSNSKPKEERPSRFSRWVANQMHGAGGRKKTSRNSSIKCTWSLLGLSADLGATARPTVLKAWGLIHVVASRDVHRYQLHVYA